MKWLTKSFLFLGLGWLGYSLFLIIKQPAILKSLLIGFLFLSFSILPIFIEKIKEEMDKQKNSISAINPNMRWQ